MSAHEYLNGTAENVPSHEEQRNELEDPDDISELSGLSDLSNLSGEDCEANTAEASWVERQRNCGMDPRLLLAEILPKGTLIPQNVHEGLLWRYIINMLNEPKRSKLPEYNTIEDAVNLLRTCKNIIVLTGAGVSVSCGIPDFRSRNGIYARLSKDYPDLPDPQAMFDITYFRRDPRPFFKFAKEIYPGQFQPSLSHHFIKLLEKQGKLLRNYSQNIDTLEHAAGIKNVITCHGSFATASCTVCHHKVDSSVIKEDIFNQTIPYCPVCPVETIDRGIMKPDIVFFGEGLSDEFHDCMNVDKLACDLLIVIGSSLKVRPVAMIPSSIPMNVPQILINREPLKHLTFDIELFGDCDVIIELLCRELQTAGWEIDEDLFFTQADKIAVSPPNAPPVHNLASVDSLDFGEINNNFECSQSRPDAGPSSLSQSEESNSCDYHGLSAIKLDDSEDGSNQEQVVVSSSTLEESEPKPKDLDNACSSGGVKDGGKKVEKDDYAQCVYYFCPPNRYVFKGAEIDKVDDDDCSSTSTDFSTDSDSPDKLLLDHNSSGDSSVPLEDPSTQPPDSDPKCSAVKDSAPDIELPKEIPKT